MESSFPNMETWFREMEILFQGRNLRSDSRHYRSRERRNLAVVDYKRPGLDCPLTIQGR